MGSQIFKLAEFKQLFDAAHRYVQGESSVQELNGSVIECKRYARLAGASDELIELLDEWNVMVNRRWNEWGFEENPLSEDDFVRWLKKQLVFDS